MIGVNPAVNSGLSNKFAIAPTMQQSAIVNLFPVMKFPPSDFSCFSIKVNAGMCLAYMVTLNASCFSSSDLSFMKNRMGTQASNISA